MILLLSSDGDYSTGQVVKWLRARKYESFLRLSPIDFVLDDIVIRPSDGYISIKGKSFDFNSIGVVWHRRFNGYLSTPHGKYVQFTISESASRQLNQELNNICDYFTYILPDVPIIGSTLRSNTNKLKELRMAKLSGLNVPFTEICSTKLRIGELLASGMSLISKSAYNATVIHYGTESYSMYTAEITPEIFQHLPETFFPSLVQEKIDKDYEIRVFYFMGKFYSMAILSQSNPQTQIDFRKYDNVKPNRCFPCSLDTETEKKIRIFMDKMNLNIGSLDLVMGKDGILYFLEVNHMGQFGMVDIPCNYGIHRDIADELIKLDEEWNRNN